MSISDRIEKAALKQGKLDHLRGHGQPLPDEPESQAHTTLPRNLEARAEYEMRAAIARGELDELAGRGQPMRDAYTAEASEAAMHHHIKASS